MNERKRMNKMQGDVIWHYDIEDDFIYHPTKEATIRFGIPQKIEKAQDYLLRYDVIQPDSAKEFLNLFRAIRGGESYAESLVHARTAKGELIWLQIALTAVCDEKGNATHAVGVLRDVTEWREMELKVKNQELHREIMMREALIYYEANLTQGKMSFGQESFLEQTGATYTDDYDSVLELLTNTVVYPEEREVVERTFCAEYLLKCYADGETCVETIYRRLTGEDTVIWVRGSAYLTENTISHDVLIYFYVSNINEQRLQEASLRERVERDRLTGLFNKITTELRIQETIEQDIIAKQKGALFLLKVDKLIDETEGNTKYYADALLCRLGQVFGKLCDEDIIGRYKKNEFVAYIRNVGTGDEAWEIGKKFYEVGKGCLQESKAELIVGIALCPDQGDSMGTLYRKAKLLQLEYDKKIKNSSKSWKQNNEHNIMEQILETLHETSNIDSAIYGALEIVMEFFGFSRGYIYNIELDGTAACVVDCCALGIQSIPDELQTMSLEKVEQCRSFLEKREVYTGYWGEVTDIYGSQVPLRVLYGFYSADKLSGIVGFTRIGDKEQLTESQKGLLKKVFRLLGVFHYGKTANQELCESNALLQGIVDGMQTCTYIVDPQTHLIKYANQNTQENFPGAYAGRRCYEVLQNRITPCENCPLERMIKEGTHTYSGEMYMERFQIWARVNASLFSMPSGQVVGIFHSFDFAEQRHESVREYDLSDFTHDTSLYDALTVSTDDYIIMCDMATNRFYFPSKMVEEFELPSQVIVDAVPIWSERVHTDDREDFMADIEAMFSGKTDTHSQEYRVKNKYGEWIWMKAKGHVERNKEGVPTLFAVVLTNLGRKSKVDQLTGLLDKYEFEVSIRAQLAEGMNRGVLLLLGLDNFRYINNIYGWEFGDNVIKEASLRLMSVLPESIQLYRLDGDKFGVFFADKTVEEIEKYYQSLYLVFRKHRQFGEHRYYCTISGGCAWFEGENPTFGVLYKQAVYALDTSKREGKNRLTVYDEKTMSGNERQLSLMSALHASTDQDFKGFDVHFQPQVHSDRNRIQSAEALLRWSNEKFGSVSPVEFIPLLEQTGLIHRVGRWVLRRSIDVCKKWREAEPEFTISVNISFCQLQDQAFLPYLARLVDEGILNPGMLHLEITESCIVDGSRYLGEAIKMLRSMGFLIEMDDFGTGYSSLEILKNAPADIVKIDQTFVRDIMRSKFDQTFIRIIVELCHSAGIQVCLEGVETSEEYLLVQPMNLDLIQGFFFGVPQPPEEFEKNYLK